MSKFKAFEKTDKKETVHRTKIGKQTSAVTAHHTKARQQSNAIGTSDKRKTGGKLPDKQR